MSSLWASWQGSSVCVVLVGISGLEWAGGATGGSGLLQTWLLWLNGPDQSHWTALWQWVKVLRHGTAFLDTTALGKASWLAGRRTQPFLSLSLGSPSRWPWQGRWGDKPAVNPKPPSIQRQVMREIMVWEMWRGMEWMVWMEGELVSARSGLDHTQLGRAGLAWGWIYEAWCWTVVWGYSGNGGPRQWCSMVTCLRSAWHHFCRNVCACVPRGSASSVFGGIQRWGRASHAETLKRQSWRKIWPTLPKEGRVLCFQNIHRSNLNTLCIHTEYVQFYLKGMIYINAACIFM